MKVSNQEEKIKKRGRWLLTKGKNKK